LPANADAAYGQNWKYRSPFDSGTTALYNRSIAKLLRSYLLGLQ